MFTSKSKRFIEKHIKSNKNPAPGTYEIKRDIGQQKSQPALQNKPILVQINPKDCKKVGFNS